MATKKHITFEENKVNEQHLKPYCIQAAIAAEQKSKADALRPLASEELQAKLDADPETKDFTGTIIYLCEDGKMYKIRVQRPDKTDWLSKRLKDPNLDQLKALKAEIAAKEQKAVELASDLAQAHPRCVNKGFVMAFLNK